jgi:hypothetical protein
LPEFGELAGVLGRERTGEGLGTTEARFGHSDRGGAAPASSSPAARECGRGGGSERRGSWPGVAMGGRVACRGLVEVEKS